MGRDQGRRDGAVEAAESDTAAELPTPGKRALTDRLLGPGSGPWTAAERSSRSAGPGKRALTDGLRGPAETAGRAEAAEPADATTGRGGQPLPPALQQRFSAGLGADLSDVRIHTDGDAADAASSVSARAFTVGQDIYFGGGHHDLDSAAGQHLLAHEVAHTIQQRDAVPAPQFKLDVSHESDALELEADAAASALMSGAPVPVLSRGVSTIARLPIMGPMPGGPLNIGSSDSTPDWRKKAGTAEDYVKTHAQSIISALYGVIGDAAVATGSATASWVGGSPSGFLGQFCLQFFIARSDPWAFLVTTAAPDDVGRIIDHGRDAVTVPDQAKNWHHGVALDLASLYLRKLTESLARVVPRYAAVWNQHVLAEEAKATKKPKADDPLPVAPEPGEGEVRASSPIDPYVIRALRSHLVIDFRRFRELNPAEQQTHAIKKVDTVSLAIQWQQKAINWARATPPDATAEDVANELYGSETFAYLITAAAPLFGFDTRFEHRHKLKKSYYDQLAAIESNVDYQGSALPAVGPVTAATQILAGPLGDEAALNQAKDIKPTPGISKDAVVERMRHIVGELDWITTSVERWGQGSLLAAARKKVHDRSVEVKASTDPAAGSAWDGQTQGQLQVVGFCRNAVQMAATQADAFKGFPGAGHLIVTLVSQYVEAAAISDLVDTARAKLLAADTASKMFPADLMDTLLETMRPVIQSAKVEKTGASGAAPGTVDPARYGLGKLERKEAELRAALVKVREVLLVDPTRAKAELDRLLAEVTALSTEVTLVANMDSCEAAWQALHESLSTIGETVSIFTSNHGNDLLRKDMKAVTAMHEEWKAIYFRWKAAATPEDKQKVEGELHDKAKSPQWTELFNTIGKHIKDTATLNKWVTFGVMVGIALITGGIGAYVEAAAGAAWGAAAGFAASTVVEAAAFSSMSYALVEKDRSLSGFFHDVSKNILMFGALKGIGKIYGAMVGEVAAAEGLGKAGGVLVQFAAVNGHALYEADQEKRKRTGQGLTEDEILSIPFDNLAFIAAVSVGSALTKPYLTHLVLEGELRGQLIAVRNARAKASTLAKVVEAAKGKDPAKARELNRVLEDALAKEKALLEGAAEKIAAYEAGNTSVLTKEAYLELKNARTEHDAHVLELKRGAIANLLEPAGPNRFVVATAAMDQVVDHYRTVEKATVTEVGKGDELTLARTFEIAPAKEGQPWRVTERMSAKAGELNHAPDATPRKGPGHHENTTLTNSQAEIAAPQVLPLYEPGAGFSGAYDPVTGRWVALASGDAKLVSGKPVATVSQFGGHAAAEAALKANGGSPDVRGNVGFVLIWLGNKTLQIRWNSRTINERNFGDRAAPEHLREQIRQAIAKETGCTVTE